MPKTTKVIDIFSGIGGLSLGFQKGIGAKTLVAFEQEKHAASVFADNHPQTALLFGDCQKFDPAKVKGIIGPADCVVGGVPCEPFSLARRDKEAARSDVRRTLINYALKVVATFQPKVFCFENVWQAPDSPSWKRARTKLKGSGYAVDVWKLNSEDYSVPQSRRRAFLVGVRNYGKELPPPEPCKEKVSVSQAFKGLGEPSESHSDPMHRAVRQLPDTVKRGLRVAKPGDNIRKLGFKVNFYTRWLDPDKPSNTVLTSCVYIHPNGKRLISAREIARIQDFPDDYKFDCEPTIAAKILGDCVPIGLGVAVAKQLFSFVSKVDEVRVDAQGIADGFEDLSKALWSCDDSLEINSDLQVEALKAEEQGTITIGKFFFQPKPTRPAYPGQRQSVPGLVNLYKQHPEWLPTVAQKKYDGANHQIHKDGDKVVIYSEDGDDNTDRLPGIVEAVKKLSPDKLVAVAEIERWRAGQHLPRETVAGYLNSKDEPDDSELVANIYDLLLAEDKQLHKAGTRERLEALRALKIGESTTGVPNMKSRLNAAPAEVVNDLEDLRRTTERYRKFAGSEGAVFKQVDAPYPIAHVTPDTWVKFHNSTVIHGLVYGREKTEGDVWVYQYGVLPGKEDAIETVELASGKRIVPVGDSFATKVDLDNGDPITIEAETVNLERSDKGIEVSAWVPRVMEESPKAPDTVDKLASRAEQDLVLQEKDLSDGSVAYRPVRRATVSKKKSTAELLVEFGPPSEWSGSMAAALGEDGRKRVKALWEALDEGDRKKAKSAFEKMFDATDVALDLEQRHGEIAKRAVLMQADPYLEVPPEGKPYRYTVQHHWRGKGVHADLRLVQQPGRLLLGWTMNIQQAGSVDEPVTTLAQAKTMARSMDKISKINWGTGEWASRSKAGTDKLVRTEILSERKAPEPYAWLNVEGATKDPEPGKAPPVGGTRQYPGVFHIVDSGVFEFGAQKPWFHEYFFHGDGLDYRMFFRQLRISKRNEEQQCDGCGHTGSATDVGWVGEPMTTLCGDCTKEYIAKQGVVLPPSEEQPLKDQSSWLAIYPDDQQPYVLDSDAVKKAWMPPDGYSALPAAIRKQVPAKYRYWTKSGDAAKKLRDELVQAISDKSVELDVGAPYQKVEKASQTSADFVLQKQTWRGPVQVRVGPSRTRWWVRLDIGRPELLVFDLAASPLDNDQVSAQVGNDPHKSSMREEGDIPTGHYLNPTKETPSLIEVVDRGKASVTTLTDELVKVQFSGKSLKGVYTLTRNDGEYLWAKAQAAPETTEKRFEFKLDIPFDHIEVKKSADGTEKRLVTGIALEPDVIDAQGDYIGEEAIERAAHNFLKSYNKETQMGLMHKAFGDIGVELVESYLAPLAFTLNKKQVKKGSWVVTVHVSSDKRWGEVKNGTLTGFSVGGLATVEGKADV